MKGPINTGGVKPFPIEGRMASERERLKGMTTEERAWRKQWLKDQVLAHDEPRDVPELYREYYNPIRRFYRKPLDVICMSLVPKIGLHRATILRGTIPKLLMLIGGIYLTTYYFKYNAKDWQTNSGWSVMVTKPKSLPGDPDFPKLSARSQPGDYADDGFKKRTVLRDD